MIYRVNRDGSNFTILCQVQRTLNSGALLIGNDNYIYVTIAGALARVPLSGGDMEIADQRGAGLLASHDNALYGILGNSQLSKYQLSGSKSGAVPALVLKSTSSPPAATTSGPAPGGG